MTRNKTTRAAVRVRMAKTGERYTTTRHHLLNARIPADAPPAVLAPPSDDAPASAPATRPPTDGVTIADAIADASSHPGPAAGDWVESPDLSDAAIARGTGERWETWFARLDAWGAAAQSHAAIARHLTDAYGVGGWWAQSITVGYERARGRRRRHQHADGFAISASKTIAAPESAVFAALIDPATRDRWLPDGLLQLRTSQPDRSARFDVVGNGSRLAAHLVPKSETRTCLQLQEERLAAETDLAARKAFWRERLTTLATLLAAADTRDR